MFGWNYKWFYNILQDSSNDKIKNGCGDEF